MKKLKKLWNDYKIWFIIGMIFLLSLIGSFCYFYSDIASNFKKDDPNGEFFKVILSILGGIGLFYGLWINSQRIKAQNKQNKLVEDRNQDQKSYDADKRFGEAIGYLGSENTSIVLGGIYALYQLAKEDCRYKSIIAGIYTSYLQDKSVDLYKDLENRPTNESEFSNNFNVPIILRTIVDLLFNSENIFIGLKLNLSRILLKDVTINADVINCNFDHCEFNRCFFGKNVQSCSFEVSKITSCSFGNRDTIMDQCRFFGSTIEGTTFYGNKLSSSNFDLVMFKKPRFQFFNINDCELAGATFVDKAVFLDVESFSGTTISKEYENHITFQHCINLDQIFEF
ncbi:MAG: pentapeptide repeat protein [Bacteroidetes bacterium]|nr:pentapeptide repeat protein [Bacteroidota bacterium]